MTACGSITVMNASNFAGCVTIVPRCGDTMSHATRYGSSHLCKRKILQNREFKLLSCCDHFIGTGYFGMLWVVVLSPKDLAKGVS